MLSHETVERRYAIARAKLAEHAPRVLKTFLGYDHLLRVNNDDGTVDHHRTLILQADYLTNLLALHIAEKEK